LCAESPDFGKLVEWTKQECRVILEAFLKQASRRFQAPFSAQQLCNPHHQYQESTADNQVQEISQEGAQEMHHSISFREELPEYPNGIENGEKYGQDFEDFRLHYYVEQQEAHIHDCLLTADIGIQHNVLQVISSPSAKKQIGSQGKHGKQE